jgi:ABC-type nitrate/sulfonate/bicarbonate transport system ATPase subunit
MAQRVAPASALINDPKVLLLDEPLGALDAFMRMRMQDEVLRLWENRRSTMLLVTHDIDEAIYMSDRIMIMTQRPGRIDREIDNHRILSKSAIEMSRQSDSNRRPADYKSAALPAELCRRSHTKAVFSELIKSSS